MAVPFSKSAKTAAGAFGELFQYTYADVIIKLLDTVDDLEKWIDSVDIADWNGGDSLYQLYKTAEGSGSRFVSGGPGSSAPVLPKYNPPAYQESTVRLFPHMDIVEITGPKLLRAHDKPGMYRQLMDELVQDAKDSHRNRVGPKYWWGTSGASDSNAGTLALVNGTVSSTSIVLKQRECDALLYSGPKAYMSAYAGARYIRPGMQLAIGTAAELSGNTAPTTTVTAVNQSTQTITVSPSVSVTDNDYVVEGDANGNEYGNVLTGMHDAVNNTGTYHGIDKAANAPWQSFITDNGGNLRDFNSFRITSLLMEMSDLGPKDVDEMDPVIFSHNSLLQVYLQEIEPVYMQTDLKALKGHTTIAYQYGAKQIPWQTARSHPMNSYHVLDRSSLKRLRLGDYGWDTSTGGIWKQIPGTFAFQAYAYNEIELVCENPRSQGKEEDIRVPTGLIKT
jgi:hypothetical protein|tara:strand:+ start:7362 stop:8708 length:1347 start_codon:yes stop_codon:yes gene_type:complete